MTTRSVRLFAESLNEGVRAEVVYAGRSVVLRAGEHLVLGTDPLPGLTLAARGGYRLGGLHRATLRLGEAPDERGEPLQVTVDRAVGLDACALRHGDTLELTSPGCAVAALFRVVVEGAPLPPAPVVARSGAAVWESSILGDASGTRRELVADASGQVRLLEHRVGAHPLDATVLREGLLSPSQLEALAGVFGWVAWEELAPCEWGATRGATLVLYRPDRIQRIDLSDSAHQVDKDPAAEVMLASLLSLSRALGQDLARWEPPPLPERRLALAGEGEKLLTFTLWWGGDDSSGCRFTVYESGTVVDSTIRHDARGCEHPSEQTRMRLGPEGMAVVRSALESGLLNGDRVYCDPDGAGTPYQSYQEIDRYVGSKIIRSTVTGHASGELAALASTLSSLRWQLLPY